MNKIFIFYIGFIIIALLGKHNSLIEENNEEIIRENKENTIYLSSKINEIFATTEVTQYFTNPLDETIELLISFPIKEEISLIKFIATIGDKTIESKVMKKEEAEEKYDNSIYSGNTGFISKYGQDMKNYVVNIGNINPKIKVKLQSFFIQNIGSVDMSYEFVIMEQYPTFHYKEINQNESRNKRIKANFKLETQSKITRLSAPFYDNEAKKNSLYQVSFSEDYKSANIIYIKNPYDQKNYNIDDNGKNLGYPGKINEPTRLTSFSILFRVEDINKPKMYYQYNKELNEMAYVINYVYSSKILENIPVPKYPDQDNQISYYKKYQSDIINDSPGLFIFLVDQSGSMRGKSIELVKEALLLFIKSLPPKSYFQLIGFGTRFKKYNQRPVIYNEKNVNMIIDIINEMEANMGGTNIVDPLRSIYVDNIYDKINLSKNIFLLTDGQINDRDECIKLITANSNKFRIHALGIGKNFDKVLIERCGKLGKGSSVFVEDANEIIYAVINELNIGLRNYLIDVEYNFFDYKENIENSVIITKPINNFAYQDEIINFSFILDNENKIDIDKLSRSIKIEISGKSSTNEFKEVVLFQKNKNIIKLPDGDDLFKIIVGHGLKNNNEFINNKKKEIEFSQKYQILSKNTALYAEMINDNDFLPKKLITVDLDNYNTYSYSYPKQNKKYKKHKSPNKYKAEKKPDLEFNPFDSVSFGGFSNVYTHSFGDKFSSSRNSIEEFGNLNRPGSFSNFANKKMQCEENGLKVNDQFLSSTKHGIKKNNHYEMNDITTKIVMTQDIMAGFWDKNDETEKLLEILDKDIINKINDKIKLLNKGKDETKIKYTILVIYYLYTKHSDQLDKFKLIIKKGEKFLEKKGIKYENIINNI